MTESWFETWTMNSFAELVTDAIVFDIQAQAKESTDFPTINRCARTSIINAIVAIESCANSFLAKIQYPELVIDQLDKLSTVEKFNILYVCKFRKEIDKGSRPFQVIKELLEFRNRYVHPKPVKITIEIAIDETGQRKYEKPPRNKEHTPILKVPYDFRDWTGDYSRIVVKETINFFNHFCSDLCGLTKEDCSKFLSVFVKGPVNTGTLLTIEEIEILKKVKDEYGLDIKFLAY